MDVIEAADRDPPVRIGPPPIDAVRPCRCSACGSAAEGGLLFQGHGTRARTAVLPGRHWQKPARIVTIVGRRFVCTDCRTTITVLPRGILPRRLYSLFAIVHAWWLAVAAPIGRGLDDRAVCALQGVDRLPRAAETHRTGRRRWSSLARWAATIGQWWPTLAVAGVTWRTRVGSLLVAFAAGAGEAPAGLVRRAVRRHAGDGAAM